MSQVLEFISLFIVNLIDFIISVFEFLWAFIVEFPLFLAQMFSVMPEFVRTGVTLIVVFFCIMLTLRVISLIRESTI